MPRNLSSGMLAALPSTILYPVTFASLTFSNETLYCWTGLGPITWNSQVWDGVGAFLGVSPIEDSISVEAKGITVGLSGIDPSFLPEALSYIQLGLPVTIYLGFSTTVPATAETIVDSPVIAWAGRIDQPTITLSGDKVTLSINCENRLVDMNVSVERRYTNDDTQSLNPGDLGCSFVNTLQEKTIFWGGFPSDGRNL